MEGYLEKLGAKGFGKGRARKRWFVLAGAKLHYYGNESKQKLHGSVDLSVVTEVRYAQQTDKRSSIIGRRGTTDGETFAFELVTDGRVYELAASSEKEREFWVNGLIDVVDSLRSGVSGKMKEIQSVLRASTQEVAPTPPPTPASMTTATSERDTSMPHPSTLGAAPPHLSSGALSQALGDSSEKAESSSNEDAADGRGSAAGDRKLKSIEEDTSSAPPPEPSSDPPPPTPEKGGAPPADTPPDFPSRSHRNVFAGGLPSFGSSSALSGRPSDAAPPPPSGFAPPPPAGSAGGDTTDLHRTIESLRAQLATARSESHEQLANYSSAVAKLTRAEKSLADADRRAKELEEKLAKSAGAAMEVTEQKSEAADSVKTELEAERGRAQRLEDALRDRNGRVAELEKAVKQTHEDMQVVRRHASALQREFERVSDRSREWARVAADREAKMEDQALRVVALEQELEEARIKVGQKEREGMESADEARKLMQDANDLQSLIHDLIHERKVPGDEEGDEAAVEDTSAMLTSFVEEQKRSASDLKVAREEVRELKSRMRIQSEELSTVTTKVSSQAEELRAKDEQIRELKENIKRLEQDVQSSHRTSVEQGELSQELTKARSQREALEAVVKQLTEDSSKKAKTAEDLREQLDSTVAQLNEKEQAIEDMAARGEEALAEERARGEAALADARQAHTQALAAMEGSLSVAAGERDEAQRQLEATKKENEAERDRYDRDIASLNAELELAQQHLSEMQQAKDGDADEVTMLKSNVRDITARLEEKSNALRGLQAQLDGVVGEKAAIEQKLEDEREKWSSQLDQAVTEKQMAEESVQSARKNVQELKEKVAALTEELESTRSVFKSERSELEEKLESARAERTKDVQELEQKLLAASEQAREVESGKADTQEQAEKRAEELSKEVKAQERALKTLEEQLREKETAISTLEGQLREADARADRIETSAHSDSQSNITVEQLRNDLADHQRRLEEAEAELRDAIETAAARARDEERARSEANELRANVAKMQEKDDERRSVIGDLRTRLAESEVEAAKARDEAMKLLREGASGGRSAQPESSSGMMRQIKQLRLEARDKEQALETANRQLRQAKERALEMEEELREVRASGAGRSFGASPSSSSSFDAERRDLQRRIRNLEDELRMVISRSADIATATGRTPPGSSSAGNMGAMDALAPMRAGNESAGKLNAMLERQLREAENEASELRSRVRERESRLAALESDVAVARQRIDEQARDLRAKDGHIFQLADEVKRSRSAHLPPDVVAEDVRREVQSLRKANQAHQAQSLHLSTELRTLERRLQSQQEYQSAIIKSLEQRLARVQEEYQRFRATASQQGGLSADAQAEMEELKKSYFFSLGVGMKLNQSLQGQSCNLDMGALYEEARSTVPFRSWNVWLMSKITVRINPLGPAIHLYAGRSKRTQRGEEGAAAVGGGRRVAVGLMAVVGWVLPREVEIHLYC